MKSLFSNAFTKICKGLSNAISDSINDKIDDLENKINNKIDNLENKINNLDEKIDTNARDDIRGEIVNFAEDLRQGMHKSKVQFEHISEIYDKYHNVLGGNSYITNEFKFIKKVFNDTYNVVKKRKGDRK